MGKLRSFVVLFLLVCLIGWFGGKVKDVFHEDAALSFADGIPVEEYYDHSSNRNTAQRLGQLAGVNAVAVLDKDERILIGVTSSQEFPPDFEAFAANVVKEEFGENKEIAIALGGAAASDVMELSYYLRQGMTSYVTERRFAQLFQRICKEQGAE